MREVDGSIPAIAVLAVAGEVGDLEVAAHPSSCKKELYDIIVYALVGSRLNNLRGG